MRLSEQDLGWILEKKWIKKQMKSWRRSNESEKNEKNLDTPSTSASSILYILADWSFVRLVNFPSIHFPSNSLSASILDCSLTVSMTLVLSSFLLYQSTGNRPLLLFSTGFLGQLISPRRQNGSNVHRRWIFLHIQSWRDVVDCYYCIMLL